MSNYDHMQNDARKRFLTYDLGKLLKKPGVGETEDALTARFLGDRVTVSKEDGQILVAGAAAGFGEALSVYDWLCDRREDAAAAQRYCPVSSLSGVYVSGSGLSMASPDLANRIQKDPACFAALCQKMGGEEINMGDLAYKLPVFPDVAMILKFYFADEEFPPQLTFLWDEHMLQFVRYETVYYIAGSLRRKLLSGFCR